MKSVNSGIINISTGEFCVLCENITINDLYRKVSELKASEPNSEFEVFTVGVRNSARLLSDIISKVKDSYPEVAKTLVVFNARAMLKLAEEKLAIAEDERDIAEEALTLFDADSKAGKLLEELAQGELLNRQLVVDKAVAEKKEVANKLTTLKSNPEYHIISIYSNGVTFDDYGIANCPAQIRKVFPFTAGKKLDGEIESMIGKIAFESGCSYELTSKSVEVFVTTV